MNPNDQNNVQYQTGGYMEYQPPQGEVNMSPNPQGYSYPQQSQPVYQNPPEAQGYKEEVNDNVDNVDYDRIVRKGFITKTYGILLSQLAISTLFISLTFIDSIKQLLIFNMETNPLLLVFLIVFVIVTIVVFIVFGCCRDTARKVPINYILLFSYTLCMSFYLSLLCSFYETDVVVTALILTCGATIGLTIYAATTKTDFTYCGAFLFAFVLILIISIPLFFWTGFYVFYCALGILIYSLYIIYDTQLILGEFGNKYDVDDYCFAALNLYIDIIYLFIRILAILGASKK